MTDPRSGGTLRDAQIDAAAKWLLAKFSGYDSALAQSPTALAHARTWATELLDALPGLGR